MFPWERRQLRGDGSGLRTWEKLYWGVFVTAISVFLFSRLAGPKAVAEEDPVRHALGAKDPLYSLQLRDERSGAVLIVTDSARHNVRRSLGLAKLIACSTQEEKAQRDQKKSHMARLVLAGQSSFTSDESDVFEGLSPREIQSFVDEVWPAAPAVCARWHST